MKDLERIAREILDHAKRTGAITVRLREDLAEALGLPREYARGRWYGKEMTDYTGLANTEEGEDDSDH